MLCGFGWNPDDCRLSLTGFTRTNSGSFDPDHAHAEQDQAFGVGHGQIEVGGVPEMLGDIGQQLTCVFHGGALCLVNAWKHHAFIILHGQFGGMVRVEKEPRHSAATDCTPGRLQNLILVR